MKPVAVPILIFLSSANTAAVFALFGNKGHLTIVGLMFASSALLSIAYILFERKQDHSKI